MLWYYGLWCVGLNISEKHAAFSDTTLQCSAIPQKSEYEPPRFFWDLTLCHWVSSSSLFQRSQCLQLQGEAVVTLRPLGPKDEGAIILPNMGNCLPSDTAHHRRIPKSSAALVCEPQILHNMDLDNQWNLKKNLNPYPTNVENRVSS